MGFSWGKNRPFSPATIAHRNKSIQFLPGQQKDFLHNPGNPLL
jgi:hypothetical protein